MDWKYWVTTIIALYAALIAQKARREAGKASQATHALQERLESYEYHPIISIAIEPDGQKIRFVLRNASAKNSAVECEANVTLRIATAGHSVDRDRIKFSCGMLLPQSVEHIYQEEINDLVAFSIPFLSKYSSEQNNFVIRVDVECSAPLPQAEKIRATEVAHFTIEDGCLKLKPKAL